MCLILAKVLYDIDLLPYARGHPEEGARVWADQKLLDLREKPVLPAERVKVF